MGAPLQRLQHADGIFPIGGFSQRLAVYKHQGIRPDHRLLGETGGNGLSLGGGIAGTKLLGRQGGVIDFLRLLRFNAEFHAFPGQKLTAARRLGCKDEHGISSSATCGPAHGGARNPKAHEYPGSWCRAALRPTCGRRRGPRGCQTPAPQGRAPPVRRSTCS